SELCSVALSRDGKLSGMEINAEPFQHGRDINLLIEKLLSKNSTVFSDLEAVSVNKGPGSYTALRIGMATAKGLCYGLDIPLIAPTAFEILLDYAISEWPEAAYYVPMIDARRMEVYTINPVATLYEAITPTALVLDELSFSTWKEEVLCFVGSGADKWKTLWPDQVPWIVDNTEIDAGMMSSISYEFFQKNNISDLFTTTPLYIKKPNITRSKKEYFN